MYFFNLQIVINNNISQECEIKKSKIIFLQNIYDQRLNISKNSLETDKTENYCTN